VARRLGEGVVVGQGQSKCRRSWLLPTRATILGRRLVRTSRSPLCSASSGRMSEKLMFHRNVASISYICCKSRSGCCIYYNSYTRMLQVFIHNVSSVFKMHVASVFVWMLHMFRTYIATASLRWFRVFFRCFFNYLVF
jgi:hypothetical protein